MLCRVVSNDTRVSAERRRKNIIVEWPLEYISTFTYKSARAHSPDSCSVNYTPERAVGSRGSSREARATRRVDFFHTKMTEATIVQTKCGKVQGAIEHSLEGYDYYSFKGIPYAQPPVGQLRFKDPVPVQPWAGVKDATNYGPECGQIHFITRQPVGGDDCLYLNIFVKDIKSSVPLPVMVWIHGGAFLLGSGDDLLYGPDYLLRKDVVLVTINYRVGVLGFLNLDDEAAPGNQGLKDQVVALEWIKENIACFNGDPNNVTIFGESAGGASVHYLTLSPLAKGLFHKAISQSGVACNPWAHSATPKTSYKICELLGNDSKDPKVIVEFLQSVDCSKLIEKQAEIQKTLSLLNDSMPFGPCVDSKSKTPFLPIHPNEAIQHGSHVPYIIGCNSREGVINLMEFKDKHYEELDNDFEKSLNPRILGILKKNNVTPAQFRRLYFGSEKITKELKAKTADYLGDMSFIEGIHAVVKSQVKMSSAPTYFYRFLYDKGLSTIKAISKCTDLSGTAHFDECHYLFTMKGYEFFNLERPKPGSTVYKIIDQFTELWTNFAKYGQPTPDVSDSIPTYWLPVTDEKVFRTLHIDEDLYMDHTVNLEERYAFGKCMKNKL